jgi:LCP family protein required for cell wall assembly
VRAQSDQQFAVRLAAALVCVALGAALISAGALWRRQPEIIPVAVADTQTPTTIDTAASPGTATAILGPMGTRPPTLTTTPTGTASPTTTWTRVPTPTASRTPTGGPMPPLDITPFTESPTPIPPHMLPAGSATAALLIPSASPIPPAAEPIALPEGVINVLLLGTDQRLHRDSFRADTIVVVSINTHESTVSMLSFPRDLYVWIPGWTMHRINAAYLFGEGYNWPGGGAGLTSETLMYNFGIPIHYYAQVDIDGFKYIVDVMGGIDVPVDCGVSGLRLREPRLYPDDFDTLQEYFDYTDDPDSYENFGLGVGVHHLNGDLAMWYMRVRMGYGDLDRTRRQQQIIRAMWHQSQDMGMLLRVPEMWSAIGGVVETNMGLGNMLELAPLAADLDTSRIRSYVFTPDTVTSWYTPDIGYVLVPNQAAVRNLVAQAALPPAANYAAEQTALVEVRNGTGTPRLDEVAADRLDWEGLIATAAGSADRTATTVIYDFTGRIKADPLETLQRALRVADENVIVQLDPNRTVDYLVIIGEDYRSCTARDLQIDSTVGGPTPTATPGP